MISIEQWELEHHAYEKRIAQLEAKLAECQKANQKLILDYLSLEGQSWDLREERDTLATELAECKASPTMAAVREAIQTQCLKENEALAAIVKQQREVLRAAAYAFDHGYEYKDNALLRQALTLDISQADAILKKRDAEVLRNAADHLESHEYIKRQPPIPYAEATELRRMADEREKQCQS